ncbi:MAG: ModD protein [Defluviitaleaceae bacterium]|nr:ModD protein [Defluviitaleaceae bacterium]
MLITMEYIERLIGEDMPYIDLTSHALGISAQMGRISYFTREDAVCCGAEEVAMVFERLRIKLDHMVASGERVKAGDALISGIGRAGDINAAWKVGQNILDNCCAIATKTRKMVDLAGSVPIFTTRKLLPGTKPLVVKATMAGGASPHRLGLSETILVFKQHLEFVPDFLAKVPALKAAHCEKKILAEAENYDEARDLCAAGVDGVQFDKIAPDELGRIIVKLRQSFLNTIFLVAGGVNMGNVAEYAKTGVDGIVTSSLYNAPPIDIGVKITAYEK